MNALFVAAVFWKWYVAGVFIAMAFDIFGLWRRAKVEKLLYKINNKMK